MALFDFRCASCGYQDEHLLVRWTAPNPRCERCGGETERLPPLINVVFTGVISATKYHGDRDTRPNADGHYAWRVKSTRNPDGSPEQVHLTTFQDQKDYCAAEGLYNPREVGTDPPRSRKQVGVTPLKGVETRVPGQMELEKLRAQI